MNEKTVVKAINAEYKKGFLAWERTEDADYFCVARHWVVKAPSFSPDIRKALYGAFGREPEVGKVLLWHSGASSDNGPKLSALMAKKNADQHHGQVTRFTVTPPSDEKIQRRMRIIRFEDFGAGIDENYAQLLNANPTTLEARTFGVDEPIFFHDETFMILPIRLSPAALDAMKSDLGFVLKPSTSLKAAR